MVSLRPCKIGVEVFQSERKLVAVESFRSPPELRASQVLDDEPEALYLGTCRRKLRIITGCLRGQLAYQTMEGMDIDGQRGEIEMHATDSNFGRRRHPQGSSP